MDVISRTRTTGFTPSGADIRPHLSTLSDASRAVLGARLVSRDRSTGRMRWELSRGASTAVLAWYRSRDSYPFTPGAVRRYALTDGGRIRFSTDIRPDYDFVDRDILGGNGSGAMRNDFRAVTNSDITIFESGIPSGW